MSICADLICDLCQNRHVEGKVCFGCIDYDSFVFSVDSLEEALEEFRSLCMEAAECCSDIPRKGGCTQKNRKCAKCYDCKILAKCGYGSIVLRLKAAGEGDA